MTENGGARKFHGFAFRGTSKRKKPPGQWAAPLIGMAAPGNARSAHA